jgi:hypothetical protein
MPVMRTFTLLALLAAACTQPRSKECTETCARESDCITTTKSDLPFDEKECVSACEVLRGDQQNLTKVEQHRKCVLETADCSAVLECP